MGVGAGLYMYDVVVKKFTFAISSPNEFLLYSSPQCVPVRYNGHPLPLPLKIVPFHWGSGPPSYTWFLLPTRVLNPNGI